MPKASLNRNPGHKANIGYNGFDMSQLAKFTSTVGQLLPVYYDILSPGDKVNFKSIIKTRTLPLNSAALTHLTEHVEWFFVPLEQLCSFFGEFYYGIQDFGSDFYSTGVKVDDLPRITLDSIRTELLALADGQHFDTMGYDKVLGALRLLDCLGVGVNGWIHDGPSSNSLSINPILFAAYQKIYMDFYRVDDYAPNIPQAYNFDSYPINGFSPSRFVQYMMEMRYRPLRKDFFNDVVPSPLFGGQSTSSVDSNSAILNQVNQWLTGLSQTDSASATSQSVYPSGGSTTTDSALPTTVRIPPGSSQATFFPGYVSGVLNPANIRALFASEKLLEITRRAGKHYDKQTLAHFGVDVPSGVDGEVIYLGNDEALINIGDVISTADTSSAPLGEVGGKGYAYGDGQNKSFEAKCHGVFMAIYSCEPQIDYDQVGVDRLNTLFNSVDFYKPEFADLGMQPLFRYQGNANNSDTENARVVGWQYRYSEFKRKFDRIFGGLNSNENLAYWTTGRKAPNYNNVISSKLVPPNYLDPIMVDTFDMTYPSVVTDWTTFKDYLYVSDPLLHEFFFDVKKASKMSVYGLPQL